jgi:hypothetical protein
LTVHRFTIRQNQIDPGPDSDRQINVDGDYEQQGFTVLIE